MPGIPAVGEVLDLADGALRHLQARRLRSGDGLALFDGRGGEYHARLEWLEKRRARARIEAFVEREAEAPVAVTLLQGISKGERMDYAVQKATELGVTRLVPVISERCVVRLDAGRWARKQRHWQAVAVAACEQCGRNRIPPVDLACSLDDALAAVADLPGVIFDTEGDRAAHDLEPAPRLATLIGPEGGLAPGEIERLAALGWPRIRLGPRILRSDTAPVAALAVIQTVMGDLG